MWPKKYKDYPEDTPLIQEKVEPSKGIVGCEMHDLNGYQLSKHEYRREPNVLYKLFQFLFGKKKK